MARLAKVVAARKQPKFKVRQQNRCELCGRPKAVLRAFKLCRICFRSHALRGLIPGVTKSSW